MNSVLSRICSRPDVGSKNENCIRWRDRTYALIPYLVSHEFVIGDSAGTPPTFTGIFKIPHFTDYAYFLIGYGVKPIAESIDFTKDNRFWILPPKGTPYGGSGGHQISPFRGRFFDIMNPNIHEVACGVKFQVTPKNATILRAHIRVDMNVVYLSEIPDSTLLKYEDTKSYVLDKLKGINLPKPVETAKEYIAGKLSALMPKKEAGSDA